MLYFHVIIPILLKIKRTESELAAHRLTFIIAQVKGKKILSQETLLMIINTRHKTNYSTNLALHVVEGRYHTINGNGLKGKAADTVSLSDNKGESWVMGRSNLSFLPPMATNRPGS